MKGFKTTVRLEDEAFPGVNQSFETLHAIIRVACQAAARWYSWMRPPRRSRRCDVSLGRYLLRFTVTRNVAVLVLALVSVAEQRTRVRPILNRAPDAGRQVAVTAPSTSSCAVTA